MFVIWLRRTPWVPGVLVFGALWTWVLSEFNFADDAQENIDLLWQSLGSGLIDADPLGSIQVLHIQPPLLNAMYAVDNAVTPNAHVVLLLVNLIAATTAIAFLVDSLIRVSVRPSLAGTAGILYAVLPGTVAYSLWVYSVAVTSSFSIAAVWGVALARTRPLSGATASGIAVLGLFLIRPTYALPFLIAWLVALAWLLFRATNGRVFVVLGAMALLGVVVQVHYVASFGQLTMSSWGGQNILNATRLSGVLNVTPEARLAVARNPCAEAALLAFETEKLNLWDPGGLLSLPSCSSTPIPAKRGIPAWDEQFRAGSSELNLNSRYGLAASKVWLFIAAEVVRSDPTQLVRMSIAPPGGVLNSGVARYLSRSENYPWVTDATRLLPAGPVSQAYSNAFAVSAWIAVLGGWVGAAVSRGVRGASRPAFWFASGLLIFHASASTLLEYAEVMRFRAEVDPVLLFTAVAALSSCIRRGEVRSRMTAVDI